MGLFDGFYNDVGVDLGTANTLIFIKSKGIVLNEPSVVAIDAETRKVLAIGHEAKEMLGRTPDAILAIRPMKDGVITDFEVCEEMLREFLLRTIRAKFLLKPRVVVCVPSGITEVEKRQVRDSVESAGAREVFLMAEPMAAAIGVGINVEEPSGNMIIDIGGGTSEIAVIALSGIVCNISIRIAGDELDEAIIQYMKKAHNLLIGERTAEMVKIQVGSAFPLHKETEMPVKGRDLINGIPKTVRVTSNEIREALSEPVNAIISAALQALEMTPPELASDIIDKGIIMTGGGALLQGLDKALSKQTGLLVHVVDDPLSCVVKGAGKVVEHPEKYVKMILKEKR